MALSDLRAILTRPVVGRVFNCAVPLQLVSVGLPSGVHVSRRTLLLAGAALPLAGAALPLAGCSTSGQWQAVTLDAAPTALAPLEHDGSQSRSRRDNRRGSAARTAAHFSASSARGRPGDSVLSRPNSLLSQRPLVLGRRF